MSEKHSGFKIDIKHPTHGDYEACLVITPMHRDGLADLTAKMERNLGREKCVQIAHELLTLCRADEALLAQVNALAPDLKHPIKA